MKGNNKRIVLLCIFSIIVLILGGYIIYNKVLSNDKKDNNQKVDCSFSPIKDVNIIFKNSKTEGQRKISDIYINNKFSSSVSYDDIPYNGCNEEYNIKENIIKINDNYFLVFFYNEAAVPGDYYLFNINGKFITDFKKFRDEYDLPFDVGKNNNGGLTIYRYADDGSEDCLIDNEFERCISIDYCDLKAKPGDLYSVVERIDIVDDKLIVKDTKKVTWEEAYKCENNPSTDCGDINNVACN